MAFSLASSGRTIALGDAIARGGEGVIHPVLGHDGVVAKIYLKPPSPEKILKLRALSKAASEPLLKVSAWPTDLIEEQGKGVRGFVMPKISGGEEAHELYSARSRASAFPEADFRFIVHVAANVARAFATVHAAGHVIGDVNHAHLLVGRDGRVSLVDVDSIQVTVAGETYGCDVGQPLFTPPELQDGSFRGVVRTPDHDGFGLAVLLFHLLFVGRHPFAGVWLGGGDMPIEQAIKEGRFAYSAQADTLGMKRPPGTLALEVFGPRIASLFEMAFVGGSGQRPTASEWLVGLKTLNAGLHQCSVAPNHFYPGESAHCPWCQVEQATGARLFGYRLDKRSTLEAVDISALWRAIAAVPPPSPDPALLAGQPFRPPSNWPKPTLNIARKVVSLVLGIFGLGSFDRATLVALALIAGSLAIWPYISREKRRRLDSAVSHAKGQWTLLSERWKKEATVAAFRAKRADLDQQRLAFIDLPNERIRRLAKLDADRVEHQRRRYLDRFLISRSRIPGIGPGRVATLASFGIETAYDIEQSRISSVQGFGPKLCGELLAWRHSHEVNFRFNDAEPIDPQEIARVDQDLMALRELYLKNLRSGAATLKAFSQEIVGARARLLPKVDAAWLALKRAEAERAAV